MHYDSRYNSKKSGVDVDLSARETRIQSPPAAQVDLPIPVALAGLDPLRVLRERYEWEHR